MNKIRPAYKNHAIPKNIIVPVKSVLTNCRVCFILIPQITILFCWEGYAVKKYICPCGYEYDPNIGDPENGVAAGTAWEDVPEDWLCPVCGLGKDAFEEE